MSNKADYFDILVDLARQEAAKAIEKYPPKDLRDAMRGNRDE